MIRCFDGIHTIPDSNSAEGHLTENDSLVCLNPNTSHTSFFFSKSDLRQDSWLWCFQIYFIFYLFLFFFKLVYSWSTLLHLRGTAEWFSYIYTHISFFRFFSFLSYYKILSIILCALWLVLLVIYVIYNSAYTIIPSSQFVPLSHGFPFGNPNFGFELSLFLFYK